MSIWTEIFDSDGVTVYFDFDFYFSPKFGAWIGSCFEPINRFWLFIFDLDNATEVNIISDSNGLYLHLITLVLISGVISLVWFKFNSSDDFKLKYWFHTFVAYYLALILFKYGFYSKPFFFGQL